MRRLAITGGIGSGKTQSALYLRSLGLIVIDTDEIAKQLTEPGGESIGEITLKFGKAYIDSAGGLNRFKMSNLVFSEPEARLRLEGILHPRIFLIWNKQLDQVADAGASIGFVVIPLLFEKGYVSTFERVICVACSKSSTQSRLRVRGWDQQHIDGRLKSQIAVSEKMARSDHVVWTEGSIQSTCEQWDKLLQRSLRF